MDQGKYTVSQLIERTGQDVTELEVSMAQIQV